MPIDLTLPRPERAILDVVAPGAAAARQCDGRSNTVFRIERPDGAVALKIYNPETATPLFPNRPADEARALGALSATGLAPEILDKGRTHGRDWLVYRWIGTVAFPPPSPATVGAALARLHRITAPDLPHIGSDTIEAQVETLLEGLPGVQRDRMAGLRVTPPRGAGRSFLHGDPVPGNLVPSRAGVTLIDWQCPASGDPILDLALYLSPAMQLVHRGRPLTARDHRAFFNAYGDPAARQRWVEARRFFAWRMALYCAWRLECGDAAYRPGIAAELAELERLPE